MLNILGATWGTLARLRASLYDNGLLRRHRLDLPVISVGGLSVGGAGKTPTTALLAALLYDAGFRPAILSRGYRRSGSEPLLVSAGDDRGPLVDAARAGDEPYWLAQVLPGVAVAVAARRENAARLAAADGRRDVFLLDDGFQHLRLARDANLLVVDPAAPFWDDAPMPAGRLRERPAAARRADAFLVVGTDADADRALQKGFGDRPRFTLQRQPASCWPLGRSAPAATPAVSNEEDLGVAPAEPLFAFAGIARPARFFDDLERAGVDLRGHRTFNDHHRFSARDLDEVAAAARQAGATTLVTTEKDSVRMPAALPELPILVWGYRLAAEDPARLLQWLTEHAGLPTCADAA